MGHDGAFHAVFRRFVQKFRHISLIQRFYACLLYTSYHVFSMLKGTKNMEYDVVMDEWEDTEVAIPW